VTDTHYYGIVGDTHARGTVLQHVDPILGQHFATLNPPVTPPPIGTILTGTVSGARGMVRRILGTGVWVLKILDLTPWQWTPGELVNLDNGTTCNVAPFNFSATHAPGAAQYIPQHKDRRWNKAVPEDLTDTPYWDPYAKLAQTIVVPVASVSGVGAPWKLGDRFSTSGGGSFTLQFIDLDGANYVLGMLRQAGSIAASQTITNTSTAGTGTIATVNANPQVGAWVPYHAMPGLNGQATHYEIDPRGCSDAANQVHIGPENRLLHAAHDYHGAGLEVNDFGVRLFQHWNLDGTLADNFIAGVTVQAIPCSGTFPTSWVVGETVTAGTYSATVHAWNPTTKRLYVTAPNGQTLAAGSIVGSTSGATATATGPALGWQRGSRYFNDFAADLAKARATSGALYLGQPEKWEGLALFLWETELGTFAPGAATWPSLELMQREWLRVIEAFRDEIGDPDLRVGVWSFNMRSHLADIQIGGFPFSFVLLQLIDSLPTLDPNVVVIRSGDQELEDPTPDACRLPPDGYAELGDRVWRALAFKATTIASDTVELLHVGLIVGHSQAVGNIGTGAMIGLDRDPDLWPSGSFGIGVSTIDPNVIAFNCDTEEWEPWDCGQNSNTFHGSPKGTCGFEVPIVQRTKMRYSRTEGESAKVGLIKLALNGAATNATIPNATGVFDPDLSVRQSVIASLTATSLPADGMNPVQRIRLTGAAGTFSAPYWVVNLSTTISGSAGVQGVNGNNTPPHQVNRITAKAGDGSWIEVLGNGFAESATLTVEAGPPPLFPEAKRLIQTAFVKCAPLNLIPYPAWMVVDLGDNDFADVAGFQDALTRVVEAFEAVFGLRAKGVAALPKVICQTTSQTPFMPDDDTAVDSLRAAQAAVAAGLDNCTVADPSDLAMEIDSLGTWPRTHRRDNGVHRTARAHVQFGFRVDLKLEALTSIPSHPSGSANAESGTGVGADLRTAGTSVELRAAEIEGEDGDPEGSASAAAVGDPATVEDIVGMLDRAIQSGGDVSGYTVNGRQVQMRSFDEMLRARKYFAAEAQRNRGIRRTRVLFR
jgi:hypothetical protein